MDHLEEILEMPTKTELGKIAIMSNKTIRYTAYRNFEKYSSGLCDIDQGVKSFDSMKEDKDLCEDLGITIE